MRLTFGNRQIVKIDAYFWKMGPFTYRNSSHIHLHGKLFVHFFNENGFDIKIDQCTQNDAKNEQNGGNYGGYFKKFSVIHLDSNNECK